MSTMFSSPERTIVAPRGARFAWWLPPAGLLLGLAVGGVARGWMRLISGEPEFTWSGTIFIVAAFGLAGLGQAFAATARRAGWRRLGTTAARVAGAMLTLPLFTGAGALMLPTVVTGALAVWRPLRRAVRVVLTLVSLAAPLFVVRGIIDELGLGLRPLLGTVLFAATYAVLVVAVGATAAPLADGWRVSRRLRVAGIAAAVLVAILIAGLTVGASFIDNQ